jgi:outer membrane protein assembly factor BamB
MYAIDVGCLENEKPCLGEPQLLYEVSKTDQGPKPPIAYSAWSPDGKQIAIGATGVKGQGDVFAGDWNGKSWINLTNSPLYEGEPAWTPNGLHISYSGSSGEPDYHGWAFMITPDGKHVVELWHQRIYQVLMAFPGLRMDIIYSKARWFRIKTID